MKKILILFSFLIAALTVGAQHGTFTDVRLVNGDSTISGTNNGTIFYNRVSNKFRFRQNGAWVGLGGSGSSSVWGAITGTLSSQTDLQAVLDDKADLGGSTFNSQSGTTYTLVLTDKGKLVETTNASGVTITVPTNASVAFPTGKTVISISQYGAGTITIAAAGGVTINSSSGLLTSFGQYSIMMLEKRATNEWYLWNGTPGWSTSGSTAITANTTQSGAFSNTFALNAVNITQNGQTGAASTAFTLTPGGNSTLTASTAFKAFSIPAYSWQWATGATVDQKFIHFATPTLTAVGSSNFLRLFNAYIDKPTTSTNIVNTANPTTTAGNFALGLGGPISISDPAFTGQAYIYQWGNNSFLIGGGASGENLSFSGGAITSSAQFYSSNGIATLTNFDGLGNGIRAQQSVAASSGSTSPTYFIVGNNSLALSGSYSGTVTGFAYSPTTSNTIGLSNIAFKATSGITAAGGTSNYTGLVISPTYNATSSHTGGTAIGVDINPTKTSMTGLTEYGLLSRSTTALSGFGIAAPTATLHVVGSSKLDGTLTLPTAGNSIVVTEGTNGRLGQTTLVSGTKAITISGLTTSSRAFVQVVTPSGTTLTVTYQAVCTSNTLTLQANVAAGTINTADGSTLNYFVYN